MKVIEPDCRFFRQNARLCDERVFLSMKVEQLVEMLLIKFWPNEIVVLEQVPVKRPQHELRKLCAGAGVMSGSLKRLSSALLERRVRSRLGLSSRLE